MMRGNRHIQCPHLTITWSSEEQDMQKHNSMGCSKHGHPRMHFAMCLASLAKDGMPIHMQQVHIVQRRVHLDKPGWKSLKQALLIHEEFIPSHHDWHNLQEGICHNLPTEFSCPALHGQRCPPRCSARQRLHGRWDAQWVQGNCHSSLHALFWLWPGSFAASKRSNKK